MKKILFMATVAMLSLVACKNSSTTDSGTTANSHDKILEDDAMIYKAIETGDMSSVDTLFTADVVDHDGPGAKDVVGKDSVLHMLSDIHNHIKDLKFDIIASAVNGDYLFTLVHVTGTPADSSMGTSATPIDEKGVDVVKLKDGKAAEHWGFSDDIAVSKRMMEMRSKMTGTEKKK
jgi:predicted SnoaL-like aldol condensation-catalyzing enzyme